MKKLIKKNPPNNTNNKIKGPLSPISVKDNKKRYISVGQISRYSEYNLF